jgi:hypothetical protein
VDEACVAFPRKTVLREEGVSDKGVSVFNAKVELYNCREWLRKIRGEVDAGLQKLDQVLRGVDFSGPGQGNMGLEWVPKPKKTPEPRGKNFFIPKIPRVGSGLDPAGCKYKAQTESLNSSGAGSSGQSRGPLGGFCNKAISSVLGLGPATGRAGILGGDSSKPKRVGSLARSSSSRSGEPGSVPISGSVPFSEKVASTEYSSMKMGLGKPGSMPISGFVPISEKVASTEYSSLRGVAEPIQLLPVQEEKEGSMLAMEERDLCVETPVSSRGELRAAVTEPIKLQVYQRSRWRSSRPSGQSVGQLESKEVVGAAHSISPVRLDFDGGDVVAGQSGDDPLLARLMDTIQNSVDTVPELGNGADTAGTGMSETDPVEGEMLNLALEDGKIMGMTCDGQPG